MKKLPAVQKKKFQKTIWDFYATNKRDALPWRKSITPYKIWISEVMLQQTQVDRTIPFFKNWMKHFPTIAALALAPQSEVLRLWKGLGYNSRALRLKKSAEIMVEKYHGKFPQTFEEIVKLPGIGPYTAGAIMAFAYDKKVIFIETNIRRVFIHHFFNGANPPLAKGTNSACFGIRSECNECRWPSVSEAGGVETQLSRIHNYIHDRDILDLVTQTLPEKDFRQWYWALMDYGSHLGKSLKSEGKKFNPNTKSRHYTKQSKFQGSDRQIRGKILEVLLGVKKITLEKLFDELKKLSSEQERIEVIVSGLEKDGFLKIYRGIIQLK